MIRLFFRSKGELRMLQVSENPNESKKNVVTIRLKGYCKGLLLLAPSIETVIMEDSDLHIMNIDFF